MTANATQSVTLATTGSATIRVGDEITQDRALSGLCCLCRALLEHGVQELRLDLAGVHRANTRLVACLVLIHRTARRRNARLRIVASPCVRVWLRVCRLDRWLATETGTQSGGVLAVGS